MNFRNLPRSGRFVCQKSRRAESDCSRKESSQSCLGQRNPNWLPRWRCSSRQGSCYRLECSRTKANQATRTASATVLSVLATQVENMVVSSADLSNSDKTDGFLKKTHAFVKGDFSGAFFQAGVSELTMACVCIGMALHGGVIPACGTFFVFSDYMKPAIRMAALMELPVKFI